MTEQKTERQWALENFVSRIDELEKVIGPQARPVIESVKAKIIEGLAARDRGDQQGSMTAIATAMTEIAQLAEGLDDAEGQLMRGLTQQFFTSLSRGDEGGAERDLDAIQARTGKPKTNVRS